MGHITGVLALRGDAPLPDPSALGDPSVRRVDHLLEVGIGQNSRRRVLTGADDDACGLWVRGHGLRVGPDAFGARHEEKASAAGAPREGVGAREATDLRCRALFGARRFLHLDALVVAAGWAYSVRNARLLTIRARDEVRHSHFVVIGAAHVAPGTAFSSLGERDGYLHMPRSTRGRWETLAESPRARSGRERLLRLRTCPHRLRPRKTRWHPRPPCPWRLPAG